MPGGLSCLPNAPIAALPGLATDVDGAIRDVETPTDVARARALFEEYAAWLQVDLCFQDFAGELASLPGAYAPPRGRLLLAGPSNDAFACIALRPLDDETGEVKRLFVQTRARGAGWGRKLALRVIDDARAIGYRELKLDTFDWMIEARTLYASLGFRDSDAYYRNPLPGAVYMQLAL